ncbi:DUF4139 domain-containing protein [Jeotgalibacillus campisalis]|uniref:DUF4139 domain-containing protein n=1 Tax=Jeotgalibacillus campisalis TaxID=220754 RepID=A0A0C2VV90_9BACL|nr:hypothetical protein [Jeotgalibacillus campisalis]KIL47898.1 hypothetical protein KR50_20650 [Jeotgalibacillus campisalis]
MIIIDNVNESQRKSMHLIVYESNFALIQEKRELSAGNSEWITLADLPPTIDELSLRMTGVRLKEWKFLQSRGINKETILNALIGEIILFTLTGEKKKRYRLIASTPDLIIEDLETKEVLLNPSGELAVIQVPDDVSTKPIITLRIDHTTHHEEIMLNYLIDHISWSANYKAVLQNGSMIILGSIVLKNHTGQNFTSVSLQAMAGETNRMISQKVHEPSMMMLQESSANDPITEEGKGDLHLYTIPFLLNLPDRQSTIIPFVQTETAYRLFYAVNATDDHPSTVIEWNHTSDIPLSKGKITFYYGSEKREYFAGEDMLSFTPKGKDVQSVLGRAVDLNSEHQLIRSYLSGEDTVEDHVYKITSTKDTEAEIVISHFIYAKIWELVDTSADILLKTANELQLVTVVKPGETKIVTFSIKIKKQKRG